MSRVWAMRTVTLAHFPQGFVPTQNRTDPKHLLREIFFVIEWITVKVVFYSLVIRQMENTLLFLNVYLHTS